MSEKLLMGLYGGSSTESVWVNSHYFSIWCRISHTEMKYMTFKERSTQYLIYLYIDSQYGSHFFFFSLKSKKLLHCTFKLALSKAFHRWRIHKTSTKFWIRFLHRGTVFTRMCKQTIHFNSLHVHNEVK